MAFFRWHGIDIRGTIQQGVSYAQSPQYLDTDLLNRHVALLKCTPLRIAWWRRGRIGTSGIIRVFQQLSTLINAGVLLPDAVHVVAHQERSLRLQEVLYITEDVVRSGHRLSSALRKFPILFSPVVLYLIEIGEFSGSFDKTLASIASYLERTRDFYARLYSALCMPVITLGFFVVISIMIFMLIIPYFADLFASLDNFQMPSTTRALIAVSIFLKQYGLFVAAVCFVVGISVYVFWRQSVVGRTFGDHAFLKMPFLGSLLRENYILHTLNAVALLLENGIPLEQTLFMIEQSMPNRSMRQKLSCIRKEVLRGRFLSDAAELVGQDYFDKNIIALMRIGEESGSLASMVRRGEHMIREKIMYRLARFNILLQPILVIILGGLVAMLIMAIYGPILSFARMV